MSVPRSTSDGLRERREVLFRIALLVAALAFPPAGAAPASAERRIDGSVVRTKVTLCEFRPRGCAGYLVLEVERGGKREQLTVQVRLGVPIRRGEEYVLLASLPGSVVSVVCVAENGAIVARSIEVTESADP